GDPLLSTDQCGAELYDTDQDAYGPERARRHPEPQHGRLLRRAHRPRRHDGVRPRLGHRRPGRRGPEPDRQRRPRPRPELHHRLLPGGGARRCWSTGRQYLCGLRPRHCQQDPRTADRRRAGQDPHPGADHPLHPEASAGTLRPQGEGHRLNQPLTITAAQKAGPKVTVVILGVVLAVLVALPHLHLLPADNALHVSAYTLTLVGKILCYAIVALALDLVWGYAGLLSLGHGLFFALGGYAMGMYLMRQSAGDGLPAFMSFLAWNELPWYWYGTSSFLWALCLVVLVPGVLAFVFGYFAFRSRIKGVYFSIMTQALTFAGMLLFFRNETGFGGNNGFTDFRTILGFSISAPATRATLFLATVALLAGSLFLGWRLARSKFGRVLTALRDAENRLMFCGYDPRSYKLFIWVLSAVLCGLAG